MATSTSTVTITTITARATTTAKAGDLDGGVGQDQLLELDLERFEAPVARFAEAVDRQAQDTLLAVAQMLDPNARHALETEVARRLNACCEIAGRKKRGLCRRNPNLQKALQPGDESGPPRPRPCWRSRSMPRAPAARLDPL
jgi:hypothetical protein